MVFNDLLNPIFSPLLGLPPAIGIMTISFLVTLLITVIYKYVTDQELMKTLKQDMKDFQKQMKKLKDNPKKMMEIQKKSMEKNMQYMMHSMKPTLFTLLPIIIIFGWLSGHLAYAPLGVNEQFEIIAEFDEGTIGSANIIVPNDITLLSNMEQDILNDQASWVMRGDEGDYNVQIEYGGETFDKQVIISDEKGDYAEPVKQVKDSDLSTITVSNDKIKPFGNFSIFGWRPGWLATYIIFSIIFSTLLRKLLRVH